MIEHTCCIASRMSSSLAALPLTRRPDTPKPQILHVTAQSSTQPPATDAHLGGLVRFSQQLPGVLERKHHLICPKHISEPSSNSDDSSNSTAVQREWLSLLSNHPFCPFRLSTHFPHPPLNLRTQICCWPAHFTLSPR
ncbi:hypothetical protein BLNAU_15335 [Blattamonas nauphoetae]|uniref:Uncharacterized protein n=1 Tax=Blattamonas nauphoetae TaxID=2049346 RepID=A0ABQ9XB52_9EUKA|nr:hypothetical protein BLNAU_15335 [Blattamonas nauphoetae]